MSIQEMAAVITRFQAATDALAALGDGAAELLRDAGCADVHPLARKSPVPIGFGAGQKA